jgi:hypothetical protein
VLKEADKRAGIDLAAFKRGVAAYQRKWGKIGNGSIKPTGPATKRKRKS